MSKVKIDAEALRRERQQKKEAEYKAATDRLPILSWCALAAIALALLLFFASWAHVYNTDMNDGAGGWEVSVDGWACLAAGVTHDYTSSSPVYKDMAVPFYYYAPGSVETLCLLTLAAFVAAAVSLILQLAASMGKRHGLLLPAGVACAAGGALLAACFASALSMSGSDILPLYCSYNPACSIQSQAVLPAVCMLGGAALNISAALQYKKARAIIK